MNPMNSTDISSSLTVFFTWLYELLMFMYLTSFFYYIYQRFRKLSMITKLWVVVFLSFLLNIFTVLCLFTGLSRLDRLCSLFSIAHDTNNTNSNEGNQNNTHSPSWVVVPLSFMVRHSDEEILAVIDESLHLSQSDLQRRRDPPNEEKLRQLQRVWATTFVEHCTSSTSDTLDTLDTLDTIIPNNTSDTIIPSETENNTTTSTEDDCMICLQPHSVMVLPIEGSTYLTCSCSCRFHKKCILEWFYFVEKQSQEDENVMMVTCPNCRHVFSRHVIVTSEQEGGIST